MKHKSTKDVLLEHSIAKLDLYIKYLSMYLNILNRAGFLKKIHLYDLMCGEGIYADGEKGSPVRTLEQIKNHYYSNNKSCVAMNIWFNDCAISDIDRGVYKIDRVKKACKSIFKPDNVEVSYTKWDFVKIYPELLNKIKKLKDEKLLLFLDPHGYKDIKPEYIRNILSGSSVELLLFMPITPMYRFANKSLEAKEFKGGESLREILKVLLNREDKHFENERDFINTLKEKYRAYLDDKIFVDTFTIQRDKSNIYALFFFTPHIRGFEKMLEAKWDSDEKNGEGFKIDRNQGNLFYDNQLSFDSSSMYAEKLKKYIENGKGKVTNSDLYTFGLKKGYLPSHSSKVLKECQKNNPKFKVLEEGKDVRKGAFYISYDYYNKKNKVVNFTFLKN